MIYGERRWRFTMERKRLQADARVYLNTPKEEALVPIENSRATRNKRKKHAKCGDCKMDNRTTSTKTTDTIEEEYQYYCLNEKGSWATTTWSPIQEKNHRSNEEYYNNAAKWREWSKQEQQQREGPPFEYAATRVGTTRLRGSGEDIVATVIEFRSGLDSECHTLSSTR